MLSVKCVDGVVSPSSVCHLQKLHKVACNRFLPCYTKFIKQRQPMPSTQQEILKYTEMLCEALKHNFIQENIRRHKFLIPSSDNPQYHEERIQEFKDGKCDYDFVIESGRKYHKIVMVSNQRSVHAFVDKKTGELYKAASWRGPAKDVRFDLSDSASREHVYEHCDWSGGYLYKS